jgi:hypothetical protein
MKKARVFFVAVAMLLVTAGVFAGKAKFSVSGLYYLSNITSGTYELVATPTAADFSTSGTNQAKLISSDATPVTYPLYTLNGASYVPVYTTF